MAEQTHIACDDCNATTPRDGPRAPNGWVEFTARLDATTDRSTSELRTSQTLHYCPDCTPGPDQLLDVLAELIDDDVETQYVDTFDYLTEQDPDTLDEGEEDTDEEPEA